MTARGMTLEEQEEVVVAWTKVLAIGMVSAGQYRIYTYPIRIYIQS